MPKVLNPNETYFFSSYFDLPFTLEEILVDLRCTLERVDQETLPYTEASDDYHRIKAECRLVVWALTFTQSKARNGSEHPCRPYLAGIG
jgi:hypothetical protein